MSRHIDFNFGPRGNSHADDNADSEPTIVNLESWKLQGPQELVDEALQNLLQALRNFHGCSEGPENGQTVSMPEGVDVEVCLPHSRVGFSFAPSRVLVMHDPEALPGDLITYQRLVAFQFHSETLYAAHEDDIDPRQLGRIYELNQRVGHEGALSDCATTWARRHSEHVS